MAAAAVKGPSAAAGRRSGAQRTAPVSRGNLGARRLRRQHIAGKRLATAEEVVRWMGALQAQDYLQALWAVGVRTRSAAIADVEGAIARGDILRTWPMRGTIHLVPAEDAGWMLQLSAPRVLAGNSRRLKELQLDPDTLERGTNLFRAALEGGKRLSRPRMMALLEEGGIPPTGQRGYHLLWYAAQTGIICLGPMEGKQQTFALLEEWVPRPRKLARAQALVELAARYFASHGPATVHDFARWCGQPVAEARIAADAVRPPLVLEDLDGTAYLDAPGGARSADGGEVGAHLLPGFDEYLLGYQDRSAVLAAAHAGKVAPGANGIFRPIIVVDGAVVGTWQRTVKRGSVAVALLPFRRAPLPRTELAAQAERYATFLGLSLSSFQVRRP